MAIIAVRLKRTCWRGVVALGLVVIAADAGQAAPSALGGCDLSPALSALQRCDLSVAPSASLRRDLVPAPSVLHGRDLSPAAAIGGCPVLPVDNIWNTPVDDLPVDPDSAAFVNTIGPTQPLHPDFGSGMWQGGLIGIPFTTAPADQPGVAVSFQYADESDPGPYPVPPDAPIEGGPQSSGDRHVLVVQRERCVLYELFAAWPQPDGSWRAGSGAVFDLRSNGLRPDSWTSADAAGLPILPGLVRYDEVAAGEIRHAIRVTAPETRRAYVWPARHFASARTDRRYPPLGQRFRLRRDFDISGFPPEEQVILRALQVYGMILADNGSAWFISGAPDERWDNDRLHQLQQVRGADFEAVDVSALMIDPDSGQARGRPTGTAPAPTATATVPAATATATAPSPAATATASTTTPAATATHTVTGSATITTPVTTATSTAVPPSPTANEEPWWHLYLPSCLAK